ncbi:uncharacterized protein tmed6 [Polymixia lowei]
MFCRVACGVVVIVLLLLLGPGRAGPLTDLNPEIADHELFWGSDQYDFSVVLPAAGQECFWHFAHHGETFYLTFMVQWVTGVGHDRHLSVTVNSPSSLLVSTVDDATGQINFEVEETGFYQMCFNNFHNHFGSMQVFLNFGVYYDGSLHPAQQKEEEKKKKEEIQKDLNNTLATIEEASHKVALHVFHMFRYYNFGRMRKSADYYVLLSNSRYVTWWSAAQSVIIITAGYLQLFFLKRLFNSKSSSEKSEPSLGQAEPGLFRGADRYDFAIVVPASGTECFWHFAHQSGSFYLTYMVQWVTGMATDHRLFVTVISPEGILMASTNDGIGQIHFLTEVTGFYQMCLGNHNNQFGGVRVFLNFGVVYEGFEEARTETEEETRVLNSTLASIQESTQRLQAHIFHIWRHYNFARMRKGMDHYLLLSNLTYVTWWSAAQSVTIILSGCLQLHFLKRLFHTDSHRPRC